MTITIGYTKRMLDKGHLKLIEWMGTDEKVVEAARQSTGKGFISWLPYEHCDSCGRQLINETWKSDGSESRFCTNHKMVKYSNGDMGLLDTLWRKKHTTPFEMGGEIIFEIKAPIMVFREWHRHRTQSYNEFSARYAQMPDEHYLPDKSRIQKQHATMKQGSAEAWDEEIAMKVINTLDEQQHIVYDSYDEWVEQGLAKEVARLNTPVSRYSQMWAKTDILNWLKFLNLRMRPTAQFEIRQYANEVGEVIKSRWPRVWYLFEEYDLFGVHLSRTEIRALKSLIGDIELPPGPEHVDLIEGAGMKYGLEKTKLKEFIEKMAQGGEVILG